MLSVEVHLYILHLGDIFNSFLIVFYWEITYKRCHSDLTNPVLLGLIGE